MFLKQRHLIQIVLVVKDVANGKKTFVESLYEGFFKTTDKQQGHLKQIYIHTISIKRNTIYVCIFWFG